MFGLGVRLSTSEQVHALRELLGALLAAEVSDEGRLATGTGARPEAHFALGILVAIVLGHAVRCHVTQLPAWLSIDQLVLGGDSTLLHTVHVGAVRVVRMRFDLSVGVAPADDAALGVLLFDGAPLGWALLVQLSLHDCSGRLQL